MHSRKSCHNEARQVASTINDIISLCNISHFGKFSMSINDGVTEMPVREAVRTSDAIVNKKSFN